MTTFISDFARVKEQNKKRLADYVFKKQGIALDASAVFDCRPSVCMSISASS